MNTSGVTRMTGFMVVLAVLGAAEARADRWSVGFGMRGDGGFLSVGVTSGGRGAHTGGPCGPRLPSVCAPVRYPAHRVCAPAPVFCAPRPVVCAPPPVVCLQPVAPVVVAGGYWVEREQQVWVEGCWVETADAFGRRYRAWQPGRWEVRRSREWVPN